MPQVIVEGRINGIDLCSLQNSPTPINAQAIADAGFEFAYVKASQYSKTKDNHFPKLVEALQKVGIWCGAYHFCAHDTDPVAQAEFFYRASGGLGKHPGELPPMVDWEFCTESHYVPPKYPLGHPRHCVDWVEKFVSRCEQLWYPQNGLYRTPRSPVIYTYPHYATRHQPALSGAITLGKRPLCLASYKSIPGPRKGFRLIPWLPKPGDQPFAKVPLPWTTWTLWQYSGDRGLKVPGIGPDCDRQIFNGSREDWDAFRGILRPVHQSEFPTKDTEVTRQ